ncbi:MAG: hypothetical protein JRJ65_18515 [Deltaproteobacteria bacterium]|nr:hypothetical protein [Deltaproteobacteria bacterium]
MAQKEQCFSVVIRCGGNGLCHHTAFTVPFEKHITLLSHWPHYNAIGRRLILKKERKRETILAWGYLIQKTDSLWGAVLFHAAGDCMIIFSAFASM